ncbi:MAG: hypothetical protein KGL39_11045 [Patescibacteria group bacterium]|nr:hypothetical protein [Patescibacteria group bacterium]
MDGATLQSKIYAGNAKGAALLGKAHSQYRPTSLALDILNAANLIGSINAVFNIGGAFNGQSKPDQIVWEPIVDGSKVQIGDYLVGDHTFCIVGMDPLMPIVAMRCTDTVNIQRASETFSTTEGATQSITTIATSVPCFSQVKRDKGFSTPAGFPAPSNTSAPMPEYIIYIGLGGVFPAGSILEGDMLTFPDGDTLKVDAVNSSTLMWTLYCTPFRPDA